MHTLIPQSNPENRLSALTNKYWTPQDWLGVVAGRTISIAGINLEGLGIARRLISLNYPPTGFLDTRIFDPVPLGLARLDPEVFFVKAAPVRDVVVIATKHRDFRRWYLQRLKDLGFVRGRDLFLAGELCPFYPTIECAGQCNLRCMSCPMALDESKGGRSYMQLNTYRLVLDKMLRDIPFLNSVCLYFFGEPLLNPDLPEIVAYTHKQGVAVDVSTNLLISETRLRNFVASGPDQIIVPTSGIGPKFTRGRTGGSWEKFRRNLFVLRQAINELDQKMINVRVVYHLYKDNLNEDLDETRALVNELGFKLETIVAQQFPDSIYQWILEGTDLPEEARKNDQNLIYPIEEQMAFARANQHLPCPIIKAFPNVRWDGSVALCCNLIQPVLEQRFLDISFADLLLAREGTGFCDRCTTHALHRYFDVNARLAETPQGREVHRMI